MHWVSLILVVLALPLALLDKRIAVVAIVAAAGIASVLLVRNLHLWPARGAIAGAVVAAMLVSWLSFDLHRTAPDIGPDPAPYARSAEGSRLVTMPLTVRTAPITKLALLEFEPNSDPILNGLEPQFIDRGDEHGFRVLAYRVDGSVDTYDSESLSIDPTERQQVAGAGQKRHRRVTIDNAVLERDERGRAHISFAFTDADGRRIEVAILETTTRRSVPTNLLAPIGSSSANPDFLPVFLLHDFEFLRIGGTEFDVTIDGRPIRLQGFPVPIPLQGQRRSFAKYTMDPELLEVFPSTEDRLRAVSTEPGTDVHVEDGVRYLFAGENLERILVDRTEIVFDPALDLRRSAGGRFDITSYPDLGAVSGAYDVRLDGATAHLTLNIDRVTVPYQRDPVYRLFVNDRSVFGSWPKAYRYEATIDHGAGTIAARWHNG